MLKEFEDMLIMDVEDYTHDTRRYWLSYVEPGDKSFEAGQFITFDLPISEQRTKGWRSYSIANMPNDQNIYELIIKKYADSYGGSEFIFEEWSKGATVLARPPQGVFTLEPSDENTSFLFLCTGVGVAPFRSMIYELINNPDRAFAQIDLVFGCREERDLLYFDEFSNLHKEVGEFHYYTTLSQEKKKDFSHGYITEIYPELLKKSENQIIYICGWRDMIDSVREDLAERGIEKSRIKFELYG